MGALDANGIYIYDEADDEATFSDLLNLGGQSVSDAIAALGTTLDTGWLPVTFGSGYENSGASTPVEVRRIGRVVYGRGLIKRTAGFAAGSTYSDVLTVPAGFEPDDSHYMAGGTTANVPLATLVMLSTGALQIRTGPTTAPAYVSFAVCWPLS